MFVYVCVFEHGLDLFTTNTISNAVLKTLAVWFAELAAAETPTPALSSSSLRLFSSFFWWRAVPLVLARGEQARATDEDFVYSGAT